ncbi:MAG: radical SAM protein, partial [Crenarchaeota archaeon]|nr:radical SAM protein [Thermoproteota archaeon]
MSRAVRARLYVATPEGVVKCLVCERKCLINPGSKGACGNYANYGGELAHVGYGKLSAIESRPIEIKPLFHYWPNSTALTFSGWGCNFYCPWCQNHVLSFRHPKEDDPSIPPQELVEKALEQGDQGLCASFNEPAALFDYLLDVFSLGRDRGLYGSMVTNGYLTPRAIEMLIEAGVDGWSIDIKGCPNTKVLRFVDHEKVFRNAKLIKDLGGHVEMVYLVVTGANDSEECYRWIIDKHLDYLGPETPLHINRYVPAHLWHKPPTPLSKLLQIANYARKQGIEYVYIGNVHDPELEST